MRMKQALSSASIYGSKNLLALIVVAALAQLSSGQLLPASLSAASSDFSISISPSQVVIPPGGTANYTITVTGSSSSSSVAFSLNGLPTGVTATISRESDSVYLLSLITSRLTRQGEYPFTVTADSGGMSASASAKLIVLLSPS